MKKLYIILAAGLLMAITAPAANAAYLYWYDENITHTGDYFTAETLSPIEAAVVEIKAPYTPLVSEPWVWNKAYEGYVETPGKLFLDSNFLWSAGVPTVREPFTATPFKTEETLGRELPAEAYQPDVSEPRYFCLDTISRVCDPNLYKY